MNGSNWLQWLKYFDYRWAYCYKHYNVYYFLLLMGKYKFDLSPRPTSISHILLSHFMAPKDAKHSLGLCIALKLALGTESKSHSYCCQSKRRNLSNSSAWGREWITVMLKVAIMAVLPSLVQTGSDTASETKERKRSASLSERQSNWGKCLVDVRGQRSVWAHW